MHPKYVTAQLMFSAHSLIAATSRKRHWNLIPLFNVIYQLLMPNNLIIILLFLSLLASKRSRVDELSLGLNVVLKTVVRSYWT